MKMIASTLLLTAAAVSLAGCNEAGTSHQAKTVGWFFDHRDELQATLNACRDNPGERGNTPDCINANETRKKITVQEMKDALK